MSEDTIKIIKNKYFTTKAKIKQLFKSSDPLIDEEVEKAVSNIFNSSNWTYPDTRTIIDEPLMTKEFDGSSGYYSRQSAPVMNFVAQSPIFNANRSNEIQIHTQKIDNWEYKVVGRPLCQTSFYIYVSLLAKFQNDESALITYKLRDLAKDCGVNMTNFSKTSYQDNFEEKLKRLINTYFIVKDDKGEQYFFRLIGELEVSTNNDEKEFECSLDGVFVDLYKQKTSSITVYSVDTFNGVKGDYTKHFYRYFLAATSKKYKNFSKRRNCLIDIMAMSHLDNKYQNKNLNSSLRSLESSGFIKYSENKAANKNHNYTVTVIKRIH